MTVSAKGPAPYNIFNRIAILVHSSDGAWRGTDTQTTNKSMDSLRPQPSLAVLRVREGIVETTSRGACIVSVSLKLSLVSSLIIVLIDDIIIIVLVNQLPFNPFICAGGGIHHLHLYSCCVFSHILP